MSKALDSLHRAALDKRRCDRDPLDVRAETHEFFVVSKIIEGRQFYFAGFNSLSGGEDNNEWSLVYRAARFYQSHEIASREARFLNAAVMAGRVTLTPFPNAKLVSAEDHFDHRAIEQFTRPSSPSLETIPIPPSTPAS
jgi:hypothetical protein